MRVHHLNCGTLHPPSRRLVNGTGSPFREATMVCHCLLVDTDDGLVLVDTGIGLGAVKDPGVWLGKRFLRLNRPVLDAEETAVRQIERLGYDPRDVRHIVLTHLDRDHAGGIADFPGASVHLSAAELDSAQARATTREQSRYLDVLWGHTPTWAPHTPSETTPWFELPATGPLPEITADIRLVALTGHTKGHSGVAVNTGTAESPQWLLHAGDAYFHHREIAPEARSTPGLALFQRLVQHDGPDRHHSQHQLRDLATAHTGEITVFSAHDPHEFEKPTVTES